MRRLHRLQGAVARPRCVPPVFHYRGTYWNTSAEVPVPTLEDNQPYPRSTRSAFDNSDEWPVDPPAMRADWSWVWPKTLPKDLRKYASPTMCTAHGGYRFGIPRELVDSESSPVSPLVKQILSYKVCGTRQDLRKLEVARAVLVGSRHASDSHSQSARAARLSARINHALTDFVALRGTDPHTARYKRYLAVQHGRRRARVLARLRNADYRAYLQTVTRLGIHDARYEGMESQSASDMWHQNGPGGYV